MWRRLGHFSQEIQIHLRCQQVMSDPLWTVNEVDVPILFRGISSFEQDYSSP
jgi:hypothetical protein